MRTRAGASTCRLTDGPSCPDYHQQPHDLAQLTRLCWSLGLHGQSRSRAAAYRMVPSRLCYWCVDLLRYVLDERSRPIGRQRGARLGGGVTPVTVTTGAASGAVVQVLILLQLTTDDAEAALIPGLETTTRTEDREQARNEARELLGDTYLASAAMMARIGETDAAWIAADRAGFCAQAAGSPLAVPRAFSAWPRVPRPGSDRPGLPRRSRDGRRPETVDH